jgi:hypothetical protein
MLIRALRNNGIDHYHVGYVRPDKTGVTSYNSGHSHEIVSEMDPETGEIVTQVSEANGHVHEIGEFGEFLPKGKEVSDSDEIKICKELYHEGRSVDENEESMDDAKESEDFYKGYQWDQQDEAERRAEKRPCIVHNEVKAKIDLLVGNFIRSRTDIKILPEESGDQRAADIYGHRIKKICTRQKWDSKEARIFSDSLIAGRGAGHVSIGIDRNNMLEVRMETLPWDSVFFGPHLEPDGSDAEYAGFYSDMSKARLKELFPDKAEDIEKDWDTYEKDSKKSSYDKANPYEQVSGSRSESQGPSDIDKELVNLSKKEYRVVTLYRRVYSHVPIVFNSRQNFRYSLQGVPKADVTKIETIEDLSIIYDASYVVNIARFAGNTLLVKEESLLNDIPVIPFYCNKRGLSRWWGKIHEAKDPQRELNHRSSQLIEILNENTTYGYGVSSRAFDSPQDLEAFKRDRRKKGFVAKFAEGFKEHIHEFQGGRWPTEIDNLIKMSSEKIFTVMNVNPQMMGLSEGQESGVSLAHKQRQGFVGNDYIVDNFSASKRRIGSLLIKAIQVVDSPESLLRLIENQDNKTLKDADPISLYPEMSKEDLIQRGIEMGALPADIIQVIQETGEIPPELEQILKQVGNQVRMEMRQSLLDLLDNFELEDYDVTVYENQWAPTTMYTNYLLLQDLFRGNPNAPVEVLIEMIPYLSQTLKSKITGAINGRAQMQAQSEMAKNQTEIVKTQIAAESKKNQSGTPGTPGQ